jgi:hypothetical protein
MKYSRNKGMYVMVASCDISKAYPKMHRGHKLELARKAGAEDRLLHAIAATYDGITSAVLTSVKAVASAEYPVKDELREGAVYLALRCSTYMIYRGAIPKTKIRRSKGARNACGG